MSSKPTNRTKSRRPNTPNTISGGNAGPLVPPFHSRRTLADYVTDSMNFANRHSSHHRVGVLTSNAPTTNREDIKSFLHSTIVDVNHQTTAADHISGMVLLYPGHTMWMLSGGDRSLGQFGDALAPKLGTLFGVSKILFFHSNVNQVFWKQKKTSKLFFYNLLNLALYQ